MSIEIYCSRFRHGQKAPITDSALTEAFFLVSHESRLTSAEMRLKGLQTTDLGESISTHCSEGEIWALTVSRPSTDERLYQGLLKLLNLEGVVVYAPDSPVFVGNEKTGAHLPQDMLSSLGRPQQVSTSAELLTGLYRNGTQGAA